MQVEPIINCHSCGRVVIRDVRGGDPMFCEVKIVNHGAGRCARRAIRMSAVESTA